MYFKKLLKKLCIFNIVTFMTCNLVPSQTIADTINVPVSGNETITLPLDSSNLSSISVDPATFTGQKVKLNITINKIEVDPAKQTFKTAADLFVTAANLAKTASTAPTTDNWVALANKFKEAAFHTAEAVFTNKDKSSTAYQKFIKAYTAANNGEVDAAYAAANAAASAYDAANASSAYADDDAADADAAAVYAAYAAYYAAASAYAAANAANDAKAAKAADAAAYAAAYAAYAAYASANANANAAYAAYAAAYAAAAAASSSAYATDAADAADGAYNKAKEILEDEASNYTLTSTDYENWNENNFTDAINKAKLAANAIDQDFVDVIYGNSATHDLWVRLTAKTKDDNGNEINPAPANANESTDWIKITNITENKNTEGTLTSITVSADMGKALMPGDYNVSIILTTP